jgi:uncharacterized membrane protein HdeD (DUF308 family)
MSFLGRVPYSLALLATAVGLVLLLGGAAANRAVHARFLAHRDDAASVNFALNFTQVLLLLIITFAIIFFFHLGCMFFQPRPPPTPTYGRDGVSGDSAFLRE